jgi:hypothetical protein
MSSAILQERIVSPEKFRAADGWYLTRSGYGKSKDTGKDKLMSLTPEQCELLRQYFENELTDYNDLMTTYEFATFLGYCRTSVIRWCNQKQLKSFSISGSLLIPKISAASFLPLQRHIASTPSHSGISCLLRISTQTIKYKFKTKNRPLIALRIAEQ